MYKKNTQTDRQTEYKYLNNFCKGRCKEHLIFADMSVEGRGVDSPVHKRRRKKQLLIYVRFLQIFLRLP